MRPPICALCDRDIDPDQGGLVEFAKTGGDDAWYERARQDPDFVGTPPNIDWFCAEHFEAASALSESSRQEALDELREQFDR